MNIHAWQVEAAICSFAEKFVMHGKTVNATRLLLLASSLTGKVRVKVLSLLIPEKCLLLLVVLFSTPLQRFLSITTRKQVLPVFYLKILC